MNSETRFKTPSVLCPLCSVSTFAIDGAIEPHGCSADSAPVSVDTCERCQGSGYRGRGRGHFAEACGVCAGAGHLVEMAVAA